MIDIGQIGQITKTFKSTSAAVPGLLLAALFGPICIVASLMAEGKIAEWFFGLAALAFAIPAAQILLFSIRDRDRLQNEEHIENKLLIAKSTPVRGDASNLIVEGNEGQPIENPMIGGSKDA